MHGSRAVGVTDDRILHPELTASHSAHWVPLLLFQVIWNYIYIYGICEARNILGQRHLKQKQHSALRHLAIKSGCFAGAEIRHSQRGEGACENT